MSDLDEMTVSRCLQVCGVESEHGAAEDQVGVRLEAPHHDGVGGVAGQAGDAELSVRHGHPRVGVAFVVVLHFTFAQFSSVRHS